MTLGPTFAQQSYIGNREMNEDRVAIFHRHDSTLLIVGDGLGGHAGGEVASQVLIEAVGETYLGLTDEQIKDPNGFMNISVNYAHNCIHKKAKELGFLEYVPKTTSVMALLIGNTLHWSHVGDSRLYIVRDGMIIFHTSDHVAKGYARNAPINRCVGGVDRPVPTISNPIKLEEGDRVFLCSDGAWKNIEVEDILGMDQKFPQPDMDILLRRLERRNSYPSDNVTAALLCWGKLEGVEQIDHHQPDISPKSSEGELTVEGLEADSEITADITEEELDRILQKIKF